MPTGYTAEVGDGKVTDFRTFALRCARQFGATIMQRDDPMNDPPKHREPSDFYQKALMEARERLVWLRTLSAERAQAEAHREYHEDVKRHEEYAAKRTETRTRYEAMLVEVELWTEILTRPVIESFALRVTRGIGKLRSSFGMDVCVGDHVPQPGGPLLVRAYEAWLRDMPSRPLQAHVAFEKLHPFMDGNGRTGRVLWLWQVGGIENAPLGFLHHWYYATLQIAHERASLSVESKGGPNG